MTELAVAWQARVSITTIKRMKFFIFNLYSPNPIFQINESSQAKLEDKSKQKLQKVSQLSIDCQQSFDIFFNSMERRVQNQVRQKRSKSKGKLQTQYRIQSLPTYNLFVQDFTTQLTSKEMNISCSLLCASSTTENAEIQTLESIQQHKKNKRNDRQPMINENSQVQVSEQTNEKTSYVNFPDSLLTQLKNSEVFQYFQTLASKLNKEMIVQEREYVQHKQQPFIITEQGGNIKGNTQYKQNDSHLLNQNAGKDIRTVKILPINNNPKINMKYIEIASQTHMSYGKIHQIPIISKQVDMKRERRQVQEQQRSVKDQEVKYSKTSIEINLQQKKMCNIQSHQRKKKIQEQNDTFSQCSEKELKNKIWQEDLFQFQHQELNQMHQRYIQSETQSQESKNENIEIYIEKEKKNILQIQLLKQSNQKLKSQLSHINQILKIGKLQEKQLKMKNRELQLNIINLSQRFNQVLEENKELVCLVQQYKQKIYDFQVSSQLSKSNFNMLQKQLNDTQQLIIRKDEEIYEISKQLKNYKQDCFEYQLVNSQLQQILKAKQELLQLKMIQLQKEKASFNEVVIFYKQKLNQDGVTLNVEELKEIKEYIQNQKDLQLEKIQFIKEHYKKELNKLEQQKETYLKIISKVEEDRQKWKKIKKFGNVQSIPDEVEQLIKQYDRQLEVRDQQIINMKSKLKKEQQYEKQFSYNNCSVYIQHVKDLCDLIQNKDYGLNQIETEFIYIVDKFLRIYSILQKKNGILQSEKRKMVTLIKNMEDFYQEEQITFKMQLDQRDLKIKLLQQRIQWQKQKKDKKKHQIEVLKEKQDEMTKVKGTYLQTPNKLIKVQIQAQQSFIELEKNDVQNEVKEQKEVKYVKLKQFLEKKHYTEYEKLRISEKLVIETKIRLKNCRKLQSLYVSKIYIREENGNYEIQFKKIQKDQESNCQKEMLYFAPQVLLGFGNSQQSYVWTLGIIIDQLYGGSLFYKKLNEIKSIQENYYCRKPEIIVKRLLQSILKKNRKKRISLSQIQSQISKKLLQMQQKK